MIMQSPRSERRTEGYALCSFICSFVPPRNCTKSLCHSRLPSRCPGSTFPSMYQTSTPAALTHFTRVGCCWFTVKNASFTSIAAMTMSRCSLSAKYMIGKIRLAMLEVAGENRASRSGCNHVYSRATRRLLRNQIACPPASFFSLHVRTKRVLRHFASSGKLSACSTVSSDNRLISTSSAKASKR